MAFGRGWRLITAVALFTAYPALAGATRLSVEVDVGDRVEWAATAAERSVVFDGCRMVVLANQSRSSGNDERGYATAARIFASRVELDGTVRDPMGVLVGLDSARGVANGGEVVAAGGPGFGIGPSFTRIDSELLTLLGRRTLDLAEAPFSPELACEEGSCLVVWQSRMPSASARLVDFTGATQADALLSVKNAGFQSAPLVVAVDGGYVIAFTDKVDDTHQGFFTAQIAGTAKTAVVPRLTRSIASGPLQILSLTRGSGAFLAVVSERPELMPGMPAKLIAVRTDGAGEPAVLAAETGNHDVDAFEASGDFVVAFRRAAIGRDAPGPTSIARIGRDGAVTTSPAADRAYGPSVSTPSGRFVLDPSLALHRIADDGTEAGAPIRAMRAHYPEWRPMLVAGVRNFLLTYQDRSDSEFFWHAVRVGADGTPIDASSPPVLERPVGPFTELLSSSDRIEAAFDGAAFVVGWLDDAGNLQIVHEDPDSGARTDPVTVGAVAPGFHLASGPRGVLVTWKEGRSCGEDCVEDRMVALPLDRNGQPLFSAPAVLVDYARRTLDGDGQADFDGTRWVVPVMDGNTLHLSTIDEAGQVNQADASTDASFATLYTQGHPRLVWSGAEHLGVFERDDRDSTSGVVTPRLLALRLGADLTPLDLSPFPVAAPGGSADPAVAFDGQRFVVAWQQTYPGDGGYALAQTFVAPDGTVRSEDCFALRPGFLAELGPTIAALPGGAPSLVLMGYARLDPDPEFVSTRIKLRVASETGVEPATACEPEPRPAGAPFEPARCAPMTPAKKLEAKSQVHGGCDCVLARSRSASGSSWVGGVSVVIWLRRRRTVSASSRAPAPAPPGDRAALPADARSRNPARPGRGSLRAPRERRLP